ncbi:hypothetical protein Scep_001144 [Stephania cephalantha]|uniref:ATP synthase F0 subunit 8 n=1 Tax=Stephania cephalantha TaxID=152367 RepID=A0AAP0Q3N9_9MAGN
MTLLLLSLVVIFSPYLMNISARSTKPTSFNLFPTSSNITIPSSFEKSCKNLL